MVNGSPCATVAVTQATTGAGGMASFTDGKTPGALLSETALGYYVLVTVIVIAAIAWIGFEIQIRRIKAREAEQDAPRNRDETP